MLCRDALSGADLLESYYGVLLRDIERCRYRYIIATLLVHGEMRFLCTAAVSVKQIVGYNNKKELISCL